MEDECLLLGTVALPGPSGPQPLSPAGLGHGSGRLQSAASVTFQLLNHVIVAESRPPILCLAPCPQRSSIDECFQPGAKTRPVLAGAPGQRPRPKARCRGAPADETLGPRNRGQKPVSSCTVVSWVLCPSWQNSLSAGPGQLEHTPAQVHRI